MDAAWGWGILFSIVTLVAGGMVGMAIQMRAERRFSGALIWIMGASIPLVLWTLAWANMANPSNGWRRSISVVIGAVAGAVLLGGATELFHSRANAQSNSAQGNTLINGSPQPPNLSGATGNFSINQQGGTVTQTYNQAPPRRVLSPEDASALANAVRGSGISVLVTAPDDPEVMAYENQIGSALLAGGITAKPFNIGQMIPRPVGIQILSNGQDPEPLLSALNKANIHATVVSGPLLVPPFMSQPYSGYIGLVIGFPDN
jgi:hypothetical protein